MEEKKMEIVDLPPELLGHIFEYLVPEEISKLSQICKAFYSTSQIDSIWQTKCSELPIPRFSIQNDQLSFRLIYTTVLHKHSKLLGFWRRNVRYYGGLLHVKFDSSNGRVIGTEWNPSIDMNVNDPLPERPAFCVFPDLEQSSSQLAVCGPRGGSESRHGCRIALGKSDNASHVSCDIKIATDLLSSYCPNKKGKLVEFRTECLSPDYCQGSKALPTAPMPDDSDDDDGIPMPPAFAADGGMTMLRKCCDIERCKQKYNYSRLEWPLAVPGAIIQPGLFKCDYGRHGVELIMLTYVDERTVEGIKVTGDRKIPSGQTNFRANLLEAFVMNPEEQANISQLMTAEPLSPPIPTDQLPEQPFRIPNQVFADRLNLPNVCKGRFNGVGQIASEGYKNSSFVPGHWIIFNENLFAFIWFRPRAGSLFHRVVQEEF